MSERTEVVVEGKRLLLSNLGKLMYPEAGFTKSHMIDYYIRIAPALLPHLKDRPITLKRYPDGITGEYFYEKRAPSHTPDWVQTTIVERSSGKPEIEAILINDLPTLIWSANLANLELHTPLARAPLLAEPTMVVFDLDPGPPAQIVECAQVALWIRELLMPLKLQCFGKTSGSKGMQLYVPLNTPTDYETTRGFARAVAETLRREHPDHIVSEMKKQIRTGKVFIDYSQNASRKTTVCVYSLRAAHTSPNVSTPVTWEEIERTVRKGKQEPLFFRPEDVLQRVEKSGDLFIPLLKLKQKLPANTPLERKDTSIRTYNAKRDFSQTREPSGSAKAKPENAPGLLYVIQKHQATRLHYDFRLEMEGVLRSWAVPKGIPTKKEDKRLAMHVEDHPMAYAKFEGIIPKSNYGAGTVMVWDLGTYTVKDNDPVRAYHTKRITLFLKGKKLDGEWTLFQAGKEDEGRRWLLMKKKEDHPPISAKRDDESVLTGRTMKRIAADQDAEWISNRPEKGGTKPSLNIPAPLLKEIQKCPGESPHFVEPMQSKPVNELPDGEPWLYELKLDGYRALAIRQPGKIQLISRNEKDLSRKYGEVIEALKGIPGESFVLDGEIVVLDQNGMPSFQMLEAYTGQPEQFLCYYAFDLIHLNGKNLRMLPLERRKEILKTMIPGDGIRYSVSLEADPATLIQEVRRRGLEGIIAKRRNSVYETGKRSGAWAKYKTDNSDEFIIGGYKPSGKKNDFHCIVVGHYDGRKLMYVSKVRNGFTPRVKAELVARFEKLKQTKCPFANLPETQQGHWSEGFTEEDMAECIWLKPKLSCRVQFTEWTSSGHLRHAKYVARDTEKGG